MKRRDYLVLYLAALGLLWLVSRLQTAPGYMDAEYYYGGGEQLAEGRGFSEPYIWNFLDEPQGLPRPSHAYWMPLASMLAALGMRLLGSDAFGSARLPFLLVTALLPPMSAALAWRLSGKTWHAWLAGLLAVFSGFYLPYLPTTDTFGVYAVLGAGWFLALPALPGASAANTPAPSMRTWPGWLLVGCVAGGMHLARADGILWLGISLVAAGWFALLPDHRLDVRRLAAYCVPVVMGYGLVMGGWFWRNLAVFGTPLSPGSIRALWILDYDELYSYPASLLTAQRWWSAGLAALLEMRVTALWQNVQSLLVVQGQIFLAPLMLMGGWRMRRSPAVQLALLAELVTLAVMTLVFPLAGWRGGYFHSGIALQALFWAVVPAGLEAFVKWGRRVRRWNPAQAIPVFSAGLVALALMLSVLSVSRRVVGETPDGLAWNAGTQAYRQVEAHLQTTGAVQEAVVMVNNPPGYYAATRRMAVAIPDGDADTAWQAARQYGVRYLILEANHPAALEGLYNQPQSSAAWDYLAEYEGTYFFEIHQP